MRRSFVTIMMMIMMMRRRGRKWKVGVTIQSAVRRNQQTFTRTEERNSGVICELSHMNKS